MSRFSFKTPNILVEGARYLTCCVTLLDAAVPCSPYVTLHWYTPLCDSSAVVTVYSDLVSEGEVTPVVNVLSFLYQVTVWLAGEREPPTRRRNAENSHVIVKEPPWLTVALVVSNLVMAEIRGIKRDHTINIRY